MKKNPYTQYKILKSPPKKGDILLFNYRRPVNFIECYITESVCHTKNIFNESTILRNDGWSQDTSNSKKLVNGELFIVSDVISYMPFDEFNLYLDEEDADVVEKQSYWASTFKSYKIVDSNMKVYFLSIDNFYRRNDFWFRLFQ